MKKPAVKKTGITHMQFWAIALGLLGLLYGWKWLNDEWSIPLIGVYCGVLVVLAYYLREHDANSNVATWILGGALGTIGIYAALEYILPGIMNGTAAMIVGIAHAFGAPTMQPWHTPGFITLFLNS